MRHHTALWTTFRISKPVFFVFLQDLALVCSANGLNPEDVNDPGDPVADLIESHAPFKLRRNISNVGFCSNLMQTFGPARRQAIELTPHRPPVPYVPSERTSCFSPQIPV